MVDLLPTLLYVLVAMAAGFVGWFLLMPDLDMGDEDYLDD